MANIEIVSDRHVIYYNNKQFSSFQVLTHWRNRTNMFFFAPMALDSRLDISFKPSNSIFDILKQGMVDNMTVQWSYSSFFRQCGVTVCRYESSGRHSILRIITTSMGIISGLSVALQLVTPFVVHMIHFCLGHLLGKSLALDFRATKIRMNF